MHKNVLFRGCTRPPMFLGVPYVPFVFGAGSCLLITFYANMYFIVLLPVVIFIMRQMARRDEMIFRLLGLRLQFRFRMRNLQQHQGMWVFTPNYYRNPGDKKS
ncbi:MULTISPECIES: type IV secretion system protein VirB3 [Lysobacter]|uniref:VirB3 family type IV secretion system protein n=1 Tax=Lysobacter gummosus TaxID=262324 RepID=A0ABY3X7K4_9GAMM|nr:MULTISPECIES: VirB3 family type IV secretion system protein [Lysobacter]MBT2746766.1 VirB3 family type IV secretion system protein [Lysobacter sp. ISL-42]MBT2751815.1 VirB3 family type IV secretion system protein [Lysobacter sp. ISL-50]MBT2778167.1 VirB3 family type IV secretion system protein [Lysobacter sp. ISL-54]MBT2781808.1 VirB3 family type IV secretion system protein [Lysobacter sp. ISL-52]UJB21219.1 VirB3 family type IV secretion system protein [Lysobacter capsici]